jgi:hypothetical protein
MKKPTRHNITLYVQWIFWPILRSIALHINRFSVPCNLVTYTHLNRVISQKNQQRSCEETWNLMKIHNVNNNAVRFLLHEFMSSCVQCSYLCMCWGTAKHVGTVQFICSGADSTTGWTEGEGCNGIGSSHWPYNYKSHRIQGTELLITCLELSADSVLCCFVITYSSAEWNRKLWANCQLLSDQLTFL